MRLLVLATLAAAACRPPTVVEPVVREQVAPSVANAAPVFEPVPEPVPVFVPAPAPEPAPTWEWAVSVLPELAGHTEVVPGDAVLATFLKWFTPGKAARVHVLLADACHTVPGSMDAEGFHGSWRREVSIEGDERRVSGMDFQITRYGITESGPGGVIYRRDGRGRWQEAGMYGTGYFREIVEHPMSAADDAEVSFAGYSYTLEPLCSGSESVTQTCLTGGKRTCERCTQLSLREHADNMVTGIIKVRSGRVEATPGDCSQACPVDEWTPLLPGLASVLEGRRFAGTRAEEGPVVFRSARGCARELRRSRIAAAAARKAEAAGQAAP